MDISKVKIKYNKVQVIGIIYSLGVCSVLLLFGFDNRRCGRGGRGGTQSIYSYPLLLKLRCLFLNTYVDISPQAPIRAQKRMVLRTPAD